ncbi:unnamed protein product, partial [Brassica oleracea]
RELKKCCLVLQLDSNEFCTTLRLHRRLYEAGEPPDNPKAIIHHSNIDYVEKVEDKLGKEEFSLIENSHIGSILKVVKRSRVQFSKELFHFLMQRRVLTQGEDLWFTFSDQLMRFSLREFHLTTGLRCEEDQTITEPQFKIMKKPYLWMLGKDDKFTVRTLYEMFKEKARSMPTLERVSLGTAIITGAVIMAENPSSKIPRDRLQRYMNYRLPKVAWSKTAYSILMRSVKNLSASSWTGDSYEVSGFALAINLWAMSSVHVLGKSLGKSCETSSSSDPLCLHWDSTRTPTITEVLELEKINNVEVSTMIGLAEEYKHLVGATHSNDADFHIVVKIVQQGYKMKRSDWEQGFVDMFVATEDIGQQRKTKDEDAEHGEDLNHSEDEEEKKDEEYQKDKEQRKDKDHSMSNSEKLDKLIQMVRNLDNRVVVIQNVLGVKFNDSSPNKKDCENEASSGDRRTAQDYENEEDTIDEEANSGDKKSAPDDGNEEDTFAEEANSGDGRSALDDENEEEICDEEAKSAENCLKQTSRVTSPTPTFNTPNFDTRVISPTPTFTSPKFDLLSQESRHSGKGTNEVNEDVEPPLQKKIKAGTDNVPLRRSERVVGVKFLEEIDELYDEFLGGKEVGVVINLEKRSITAFNCAAMKFTDASLVPYVNAYTMALPFMIHNFFKDVNMDTSKLSIKIVSEGFPQVLKIEDSGFYALKLIECHAMPIVDLTKLSEEKIAIIREKLAVDIFSELQ